MTTSSHSPTVLTKRRRRTIIARKDAVVISHTAVRPVRGEGGGVRGVRVGGPQGSRQDVVIYGLTTPHEKCPAVDDDMWQSTGRDRQK